MKPVRARGLAAIALCAAGTVAAAPLPLKPGIYVAEGVSCDGPPNAAIMQIAADGSLHTAHESGCSTRITPKGAQLYAVHEFCKAERLGPAQGPIEPYVNDSVIRILSDTRFRKEGMAHSPAPAAFRLCPGLAW